MAFTDYSDLCVSLTAEDAYLDKLVDDYLFAGYDDSPISPIFSSYLGFWADAELYDRSGTIHTLPIGSLFIALTDIPIVKYLNEFTDIHSLLYNENSYYLSVCYSDNMPSKFKSAFFDAYKEFSSHHIILGDALLSQLSYFFHEYNFTDNIYIAEANPVTDSSREPFIKGLRTCIKISREIVSFSNLEVFHELIDTFFLLKDVSPHLFSSVFIELVSSICNFFSAVQTQVNYFSTLISSILLRTENPPVPILRYIEHSSLLDAHHEDFLIYWDSSDDHALSKRLQKIQKRVIKDPTADEYEEAQGNRLIYVYNTLGIYDAAMAEFDFMCANNIDLCKCKNCGKFFRPLSIASNFCDRPLDNGSKQTCRSSSGKWYSDNRRSNNPAWDEFMKYKSKYNSRTNRNKRLNPPERFDHWKTKATELVKQYENGEITIETFYEKLKEMDKDMRPLNKM